MRRAVIETIDTYDINRTVEVSGENLELTTEDNGALIVAHSEEDEGNSIVSYAFAPGHWASARIVAPNPKAKRNA